LRGGMSEEHLYQQHRPLEPRLHHRKTERLNLLLSFKSRGTI
jgi:hypothetical protein